MKLIIELSEIDAPYTDVIAVLDKASYNASKGKMTSLRIEVDGEVTTRDFRVRTVEVVV